jgi:hypothetical protein
MSINKLEYNGKVKTIQLLIQMHTLNIRGK